MEYLVPSSGKLYHHKIKISDLQHNSDSTTVLENLKKRHSQYFTDNKISDSQIKGKRD